MLALVNATEESFRDLGGGLYELDAELDMEDMFELLDYADKRVLEETVVSLDERFASSRFKCRTPEARMNHQRRYEKAVRIEQDVFRSDQ